MFFIIFHIDLNFQIYTKSIAIKKPQIRTSKAFQSLNVCWA